MKQGILHAIGQRSPTGIDDIRAGANSAPATDALSGLDQDASCGGRVIFSIKYAHLLIFEANAAYLGEYADQRLP